MHYTLVDYEHNITTVTFHPMSNSASITYFIDTEDRHYIDSPQYTWKQGGCDTHSLHYHDENKTRVMYKRFITNALKHEDTCALNNNKKDLRKNNIIKYPKGKIDYREELKESMKAELIPFEIDLEKLKPASQKSELKKEKKKKSKKKDKKKKDESKKKKAKKK
ncbi:MULTISPECIES: hypothetical protein [Solibacillus]|uniref:Uncharacterized protein n=1 Tax=Solibacillus merdavium TaxID=2762218 RepID=A0ABR8XSG7_9BACL|nr:hypothetical protein [Solibacillus merdavium]MBD8034874.1 hypothetical protein [Solibacillus merdavium]